MNTAVSCRKCGSPVTPDARDGVCPKCLFNLAAAGIDPLVSEIQNPKSEIKNLETVLHSFGDYELLEEIARGGMGVVYKARQKSLGRIVAVKLILAGQFAGKQIAQRFKSEAIAAAVLQHPNIVAVHEVGVHEGQHFFSMDYVEGQNLAELVAQRPLSPREAARYVKLIAEAIHYAHGQGILHRDLKPSNVLIDSATDQPRVTDFGLAKRLDGESSLTVTGQVLGSPHFMPPEQAGVGGKVGRASDVFGLGGILYFLLTARAPFQGETIEATIQQVLHAESVSPRLLNATVPLDLETICLKCLEKEPSRRYQMAGEVVEELERFLRDEPILARPLSRVERTLRWCRRKPAVAALATATILLLLAVVIGSPIALYRIQESARRARRLLYASDMNLAQQALKLNNLGKARRLLDRHRPNPGEEDLRGWEWRYLWQLTRGSEHTTLTNRKTPGFSVGFSPDGKSLAVGWWDGRVDLWDVPARRWVRALTDGERPHPGRVAFSPVRNLLAATSETNAVTLYDLDSGRESILWRGTDQGGWDFRDLAFSQDGSKLVIYTGSNPEADDAVWVVDVSSSRIESRHPAGRSRKEFAHTGAARLSPDNRRLYWVRTDDWNGRIQCIDVDTSKELWQTEPQGEHLMSLDISPDGRVLASASGWTDTTIHLWDTATGEELKQLDGHTAFVLDLAFTRDGRRLVSAGGDQTIRFWDTNAWTESQEPLRGHAGEVWAITTSEPEQLIASVSKDGDLKLWTKDGKGAADGYRRLSKSLGENDVQPLDHSRVLLLPRGKPPELVDLKRDSPPVPLPGIGSSDNVLGCFGTNLLCVWNVINDPISTNLLSNGSFSNGLTGWVAEQHKNAHASFTRTFDFTNNQPSVKVSVTNAGTTGWYIQLNYPNLILASNLVYTISFAAKATPATNAEVSVTQAHPDWLRLGYYRSLSLTTNWQWFTHTFQPSAGDTNARVRFGGMGDKLATFWFADVRLQAGTNQTNQILVGELRGAEFVQRGAIALDSGRRPTGFAYNPARRLLAWSEGTSSRSLYLASLSAAGRRIELRSDVPGLVPVRFSEDGKYLAAAREPDILRAWNVETGQIAASINQNFLDACFAAKGSVLVVALHNRIRGEIGFYDLARPDRVQRVRGGFYETRLAVSPDGGLVSATSNDGEILLLDPALRKGIDSLRGHLIVAFRSAFSPDGRRLISTDRSQEAVKLWDVSTRQELLTLASTDPSLSGVPRWNADGNVILAGPPWQAWSAPSWEEIAAAEAKEKTENKKP